MGFLWQVLKQPKSNTPYVDLDVDIGFMFLTKHSILFWCEWPYELFFNLDWGAIFTFISGLTILCSVTCGESPSAHYYNNESTGKQGTNTKQSTTKKKQKTMQ